LESSQEKLVLSLACFLSGWRISLIAADLRLVFLLGILMMGVAIFRLYESSVDQTSHLLYAYIALGLLFFNSFCLKSVCALIIALVMTFVTASMSITKVRLGAVALVIVVGYFYFDMDFVVLFQAFEEQMGKVKVLEGIV
jgi:hypothetical protein